MMATEKKSHRYFVVGGTNTTPSLRERRRHRRGPPKSVARRSRSAKTSKKPAPRAAERDGRTSSVESATLGGKRLCDFCTKVHQTWKDTNGLRKKTVFSDVTMHSPDAEFYYCNSFVLSVWSNSLLDGARCEKGQSGEEEWTVYMDDVFSGEILQSALRYMYGGGIYVLPPPHMSEIVKMADSYQLEDVKRSCFVAAETLPPQVEDAVALWLFAEEHKLTKAIEQCMRFIYVNVEKVVVSGDWTRVSQREDLLQALFEMSIRMTTVNPDWRSVQRDEASVTDLAKGIRAVWNKSDRLRKSVAFSDVMIVTKGGNCFNAHTQLIFTSSPIFAAYLHEALDAGDTAQVFVDDIDDDVVEEFLRFLYFQPPSSKFPEVAEFVHILASTHQVRELMRMCEREMATHELTSPEAAIGMLREAEEHRMSAAKSTCFRYIYSNYEQLRNREDWRTLIHDEPQLLTEMVVASKGFRKLVDKDDKEKKTIK